MTDDARFDEIDEEIAALHGACEQYEQAIGLLSELLTAVVMAIPREGARYDLAATHIENFLANRDAMGKAIAEIPRRLAEQLLDDLSNFAGLDGEPPAPNSPPRMRFSVIQGSKE